MFAAINEIIKWVDEISARTQIVAVAYRVVQGGPSHLAPEKINLKLIADLENYIYLAPNHLPAEIELIRQFRRAYIGIPHIACFDTYFHQNMPTHAKIYALPEKYTAMGLVRYGFHGISYESIFSQLLEEDTDVAAQKIIIAHLGSGSSMVALSNGISKETTMGISPMGGLVMATRPGDLDPGAILFLLKEGKLKVDELDELLSKESGLKAISGTGNMLEVLQNSRNDAKANQAIDLYCYQAKKQIGALAAAIGGLNMLIFCGGIGENSSKIRKEICTGLDFLGITIDKINNNNGESIISNFDAKVTVRVMQTDEETMIALHAQKITSNTN
ncbi:MAG: acetate/propionate family kinase [Flavobacterium sp.]|nr:MAG: acetate/propionate family kinase [Flavobacterium sp.]